MPTIASVHTWSNGDVLTHTDLNGNFAEIRTTVNTYGMFTDVDRTVTANLTFSPSSGVGITVSTGGITITAGGLTVSAGGFTVTGNSTLTGTLGGLTGLTVASGGLTVTAGGLTVTAGGLTVTAGNLTMSGGQAIAKRVDDGDSSTADTIDWNAGNIHRSRLTGNCTYTFNNPQTGATYRLEVLQDGTGSRTVTWPAAVKWDNGTTPTLTTTANRKDTFDFYYNGGAYIGTTHSLNVADTT